jgi:hypothetical protein
VIPVRRAFDGPVDAVLYVGAVTCRGDSVRFETDLAP